MSDTQPFTKTRFKRRRSNLRISTMVEHKVENTTMITAENFLPAINGCFEKLSEVQWDMIKNGAWDSDVKALLADLISELIQITSDKILRFVLPFIQSQMVRGESPEDVRSAESCPSKPASALSTAEQSIILEESPATSSHAVPTSQPGINLSPEKSSARSRRYAARLRSKNMSLEESPATSSHAVPTSQPGIGLLPLKALMRSAILNVCQRFARVKRAIEMRGTQRNREDKKTLTDFVLDSCKDEVTLQWLEDNPDTYFEYIDKFSNIFTFLEEKIKKEEKKKHSNIIDIIFVSHGAITDSTMSASSLLQPGITDVLLYSPWNCGIDGKAAYSIATGRLKPEDRKFRCSNKKCCKIPDAGHQPTKLPDEWNSMKKAGDQKIPEIILSPLQPKDSAWRVFERLETQHGKAGRNRIVIPFLPPDNNKKRVPLSIFTLTLSEVLLFSRFEATLHLTACLKRRRNVKIDEDALMGQYACTIDNSGMTSSADLSLQESDDLFRAFKALFG